jgi:hypothetical protein
MPRCLNILEIWLTRVKRKTQDMVDVDKYLSDFGAERHMWGMRLPQHVDMRGLIGNPGTNLGIRRLGYYSYWADCGAS